MSSAKRQLVSTQTAIVNPDVAKTFASYEASIRTELFGLRDLIFETADQTTGVGPLEETLKWGQPSYLTTATGAGSTVRIAPTSAKSDHDYAMYFICHTNLVEGFKDIFGDALTYDSNRALLFSVGDQVPTDELSECVSMALTYHLTKG